MECLDPKYNHGLPFGALYGSNVTWEQERKRGAGATFSKASGLGANPGAFFI